MRGEEDWKKGLDASLLRDSESYIRENERLMASLQGVSRQLIRESQRHFSRDQKILRQIGVSQGSGRGFQIAGGVERAPAGPPYDSRDIHRPPKGTLTGRKFWESWPFEVDIYFSAGAASCTAFDSTACTIYRVRARLDPLDSSVDPVFEECEPIVGPTGACGAVQTALSANGERMAYIQKCSRAPHELVEGQIDDSSTFRSHYSGEGSDAPQFPAWLNERELLFATGGVDELSKLWKVDVESGESPSVVLGSGSEKSEGMDFRDPNVRRGKSIEPDPESGEDVAFDQIVTFGSPSGDGGDEIPTVHDLSGTVRGTFRLDTSDPRFFSCHHPAWNIDRKRTVSREKDGGRILCMRQERGETVTTGKTDYTLRMLYSFRPGRSGDWEPEGYLFHPLDPSDFPVPYTLSDDLGVNYKFGEWCGSDDFIVTTLFIDQDSDRTILYSRVVLIRIAVQGEPLEPPRYYDLTSLAEDLDTEVAVGSHQGVYATCSHRRAILDFEG